MTTQGIEAGTGETARLDGEATKARSALADAPDHPTATDWQNRAERAEAECKELRERLPKAFKDRSCTLSKHGPVVIVDCDDSDEAWEVYEWLFAATNGS